ncbi:diphthine synthase [archaeon]|nr:diphthine synthase [archaeon]
MLCLVGLGLATERDLSLRAFNVLAGCDVVYLEGYTGVFDRLSELEDLLDRSIHVLSRQEVESSPELIERARKHNVALLVQGDPFSATTHVSLILDCVDAGVKYLVVNSSSVFSGVARTGLSLYKFGKTASIPFPGKNFKPDSFLRVISDNLKIGAHTLCLLDVESDAHDFMTIPEAVRIIERADKKDSLDYRWVGCARLGFPDEVVKWVKPSTLKRFDWPAAPHCLVIPSKKLHFMEKEALKMLSD